MCQEKLSQWKKANNDHKKWVGRRVGGCRVEIGGSGTGSEEKYLYLGSTELQHIAWPGTGDCKAGRENSLVMNRGYYHRWICTVGDVFRGTSRGWRISQRDSVWHVMIGRERWTHGGHQQCAGGDQVIRWSGNTLDTLLVYAYAYAPLQQCSYVVALPLSLHALQGTSSPQQQPSGFSQPDHLRNFKYQQIPISRMDFKKSVALRSIHLLSSRRLSAPSSCAIERTKQQASAL
ncbi:hypothetical protein GJ744_009632 [Endocarpon pusillum]|uniref:Uncharacterized protein n=1 Tax=Endocarpon pusillum TaxID=364733 RepID=A0A8H7AFC1_9EURO|nr:hypothetical protein GJ744_009632 [Endocarpon pusillum]